MPIPVPELESQEAIKTAVMMIRGVMTDLGAVNNNDYRLPALSELIEKMEDGKMPTKQAIEEAHKILEDKQIYN